MFSQRIATLNAAPIHEDGQYVLYWMQQSQRARHNHALEYAISEANRLALPIACLFCITNVPDANARMYSFMLEGLRETADALRRRSVSFAVRVGSPIELVPTASEKAALVVTDRGYLRWQKAWRSDVADELDRRFVQLESDVVVPAEVASHKAEFSAATLRRKISPLIGDYLKPVRHLRVKYPQKLPKFTSDINIKRILRSLSIDKSVGPVETFVGGYSQAKSRLREFVTKKLPHYPDRHSDPTFDAESHLSPYLHFGQISPIEIALAVKNTAAPDDAKNTFLEQLIVRRELAANFVHFTPNYDQYAALPAWAQQTLKRHRRDKRLAHYSLDQLEACETDDPYWNAAQSQMVTAGKMHNYMRMYWGKRLLEWSPTPEEAFERALYLNNKYELDGRDPNGFVGVAWCFGLHDRPWAERPIFGKVRYMNANGLRRKFDIEQYVERWRS